MKNTLQLKIYSIDKTLLAIYLKFLKQVLNKLNITYSHINLPMKSKKITLLKSPHIHKKAREQFEMKTFKTLFNINKSKHLTK